MVLAGLQKLSLLDFPGLVACTIFTAGCNLRCPWCHNAGLVLPELLPGQGLSEDEVLDFLGKRRGVLDGVCVTGGEPLLHPDLPGFLGRVRELGFRIKLDTNGSFPDRLRSVVEAGLVDYVAMDIKNSPPCYGKTVGVPEANLEKFTESREYLLSDVVDYEFRTTVVKGLHTRESLLEAAEWIRGAKRWYLQQFRDSGSLIQGNGLSAFSEEEMRELLTAVQTVLPAAKLRGIEPMD